MENLQKYIDDNGDVNEVSTSENRLSAISENYYNTFVVS